MIKKLIGSGGGKGGDDFYEAPNTAQSTTVARLLETYSCGQVVGLVNGAKSIYLDETPLVSENGIANFQGISWEQRVGTVDQAIISGFEDIREEGIVGVEVKYNQPVVRRIQTTNVQAIIIKLQVPSGLSYLDQENNQLVGTSVSCNIEISYEGGAWQFLGTALFTDKTTSAYERSLYFPIQKSEEIEIRVTRNNLDSTQSNLINATAWAGYTLLSGYKLNYPNIALMGYNVDASEFGSSLPARSLHVKGLIVEVPSNYNPDTRTYSGIWDGTFKRAYTNNPAWLVWWILTDKINGIGADIPEWTLEQTKIDLYEIAQYNDGIVPDGFGGYEPRFTFNAWIVERQNAFELLQKICGSMNAMIFWCGNTIKISQDSPKNIEHIFSNSNVIDGSFVYNQTPLSSMHSRAIITYNNMEDYGKSAVEIFEDVEQIHKIGNKELDVTLLGCTSRGQARRAGAHVVYTEKNENETVTFKVGLADCQIVAGDIIGIADTQRQGVPYSGRLKKVEEKTLYLDRTVEFKTGVIYEMLVVLSNGQVQRLSLVNPEIETDLVEFVDDLLDKVVNGANWVLTSSVLEPTEWRVLGISEEENATFGITALKHDKRKFDSIELGFDFPTPTTSLIPSGEIPAPYNLVLTEYLYKQSNNSILSAVLFSWTPQEDPRIAYYEVRFKRPNDTQYEGLGIVKTLSIDIKDLFKGQHIFEVRAISAVGLKSVWTQINFNILGVELPLPNIQGLDTVYENNRLYLLWDSVDDVRNFDYQVKHGVSWGQGQIIYQGKERKIPIYSSGYYHVKAVYQNAQSSTPASLEIENVLGDGLPENIIAVIDEKTDIWNGNKNGFVVVQPDNYLLLDTGQGFRTGFMRKDVNFRVRDYTGDEGVYTILEDKEILLSANNTCSIAIDLQAYSTNIIGSFRTTVMRTGRDMRGNIYDGWYAKIQMQKRSNGVWGNWHDFYASDYIGDGFRFRVIAKANKDTLVYITKLKISVDVPDRDLSFNNVNISDTGTFIAFEPPFNTDDLNVQTTILDTTATLGENVEISKANTLKNGITVFVKDKDGNNINKTIDLRIKGY